MADDAPTAGFWRSIPGILTAGAGIITAGAGLIVALSQAGVLERAPERAAASPVSITGRWTAQVAYPWNYSREEVFEFRVEEGTVLGTATYLGVPRAIEDGKVAGDHVTFSTRAQEILGTETRDYQNRYDGLVTVRGIQFVLQDTRGVGPIEFAARKND
jgi:hypothetical protein